MNIPFFGTIYFAAKSELYFHKVRNATRKYVKGKNMTWMKNSKNPFFTIFMKNSSIVINWKKHIITFEIHINDEKDMIQVAEYISLVVIDLNCQFLRADMNVQEFYDEFLAPKLNQKLNQYRRQIQKEIKEKEYQDNLEIKRKQIIKEEINLRDREYKQQQLQLKIQPKSPDPTTIWHGIWQTLMRHMK